MIGRIDTALAEITDHGGNLARMARLFPNAPAPWLDLSTGINPHAYPFTDLPAEAFLRLPEAQRVEELQSIAATAYGAASGNGIVAAPGTQILLPLVASLVGPGRAAILSPTYAEHRRAAAIAGHDASDVTEFDDLASADLAVVVNPNNPDGRIWSVADLLALADQMARKNGLLVVDEAFMDVGPADRSLASQADHPGFIVLRSFGKFFGLAGVRLGFALGPEHLISRLRSQLGPWAVAGPALELGCRALADTEWQATMRATLAKEALALDRVLSDAGIPSAGGTDLFRLVRDEQAARIHHHLGSAGILVRAFERDAHALRFGLPGGPSAFGRLADSLHRWRHWAHT